MKPCVISRGLERMPWAWPGLATQAKHRLKAFLLRQGRRYPRRAGWTRPSRRWLTDLSVGDIRRFTHPRQLMAYLGLVPSE